MVVIIRYFVGWYFVHVWWSLEGILLDGILLDGILFIYGGN
jgi:hypothetical protein